jgi:prolyl oligopeptidase
MPKLMEPPPHSCIEVVTDLLHGVPVADPYRWLEDQDSPRTRAWIAEQTRYARSYLDAIPGRQLIRRRIREFLAVETYDSLQKAGDRYFFRKRLPHQEQACIYMRNGADGEDQLLVDPAPRGTGPFTAVKLVRVSPDGRLLLYEVKEGGERTGTFELLDIEKRERLPDSLPLGLLRGFVFAPDGKAFYYSLEVAGTERPFHRAIYRHVLGSPPAEDEQTFYAGEDKRLSLFLVPGEDRLGLYIKKYFDKTYTDFSVRGFESDSPLNRVLFEADYLFEPRLMKDRILAMTDCGAPNLRIVNVRVCNAEKPDFVDVVPERDRRISSWTVVGQCLFVSYVNGTRTEIHIYDLDGRKLDEMPTSQGETVCLLSNPSPTDELLAETQSFTEPSCVFRYSVTDRSRIRLTGRKVPLASRDYGFSRVSFPSNDGTSIPMFLVGREEILAGGTHPTIMTSYGGYGVSMTPQFSIFVAFLMECGCLFALPNIRGGSEFGREWHKAAKRRNRQTAYDDFLSAAEYLIKTGRSSPGKLAIFGGSNSGLLVGAALTQRPHLFGAVVCMVPMLDMLRYHLFDNAHIWKDEFGTVDDPDDFAALLKYSPYHQVRQGVAYPATMIVSGDADQNCNPLHARKMTARLQAANVSGHPIFLDYNKFRGHSPVLPLTERMEALTDRMAFLCDQLQLPV